MTSRALSGFRRRLADFPYAGPFVVGFALPRAARDSALCFWVLVAVNSGLIEKHFPGSVFLDRVLLGLYVAIVTLVAAVYVVGAALFFFERCFSRAPLATPDVFRLRPAVLLKAIPHGLFFVWAALFVAGRRAESLEVVAVRSWAVFFAAGLVLAIIRGLRACREATRRQGERAPATP